MTSLHERRNTARVLHESSLARDSLAICVADRKRLILRGKNFLQENYYKDRTLLVRLERLCFQRKTNIKGYTATLETKLAKVQSLGSLMLSSNPSHFLQQNRTYMTFEHLLIRTRTWVLYFWKCRWCMQQEHVRDCWGSVWQDMASPRFTRDGNKLRF